MDLRQLCRLESYRRQRGVVQQVEGKDRPTRYWEPLIVGRQWHNLVRREVVQGHAQLWIARNPPRALHTIE